MVQVKGGVEKVVAYYSRIINSPRGSVESPDVNC